MRKFNILVVGAGVAGLTCAGLLKKQGVNPTVVEKDSIKKFNKSGYMLGILPLGGRVMTALDLMENYFGASVEMKQYEVHKENGQLNHAYSLDFINRDYGSYRGIERAKLIDLLMKKVGKENVLFGTQVAEMKHDSAGVEVTFSSMKKEMYDLVIIADGLHSDTRKLLWDESEYDYSDTGWGGWVAWLEDRKLNAYKEYWGASSFMGLYPVKDKIGVFLGGPNNKIKKQGLKGFAKNIMGEIHADYELLHQALNKLSFIEKPYYWEFHDCRTKEWRKGAVLLLGDAACGFLPTAGVGASMAMDSAAALVDELSRSDKDHLEYGLKLYEKRQKERVEKAQEDSRSLGKMMFVNSKLVAGIRDYAIRFYSIKQLAKDITKTIEG